MHTYNKIKIKILEFVLMFDKIEDKTNNESKTRNEQHKMIKTQLIQIYL